MCFILKLYCIHNFTGGPQSFDNGVHDSTSGKKNRKDRWYARDILGGLFAKPKVLTEAAWYVWYITKNPREIWIKGKIFLILIYERCLLKGNYYVGADISGP